MKTEQSSKSSFEEAIARGETIVSGTLKFSTDYVSTFLLYQATLEWINSDKNLISASIRGGGSAQKALDFKYDMKNVKGIKAEAALHKIFVPFFKEKLGGDYIKGWDYSSDTILIK